MGQKIVENFFQAEVLLLLNNIKLYILFKIRREDGIFLNLRKTGFL